MSGQLLRDLRVLLVEDDFLIAQASADTLCDCGAVVIGPVPHLAGALAVINDLKFDLALLDVNLQGERVYPAARKLAAQGVPFALVTGYSRTDLPAEFWQRPLLPKPFLPRQLTELVAQMAGLKPEANG